MSRISLRQVDKTYPSNPPVHAVDQVDLDIDDGCVTTIVGPSGCGKTTVLRLIAGFERPDAGSISIGDDVVATQSSTTPPERRRVGIVPQYGALFPHLDVSANVRFALPNRRSAAAHERAQELLDLVGLTGLDRRMPHQLSGGQQQRVALARALAPRPRVVLLDEPFTALDTTLRSRLRTDVLAVLRESAATAVLVTHDPAEALSMSDRVAVMRMGRIEQEGRGSDLYTRPTSAAVARALGDVATLAIIGRSATSAATAFGSIECAVHVPDADVVLVRPEQLVIDHTSAHRAEVRSLEYFGFETMVTVVPLDPRVVPRPIQIRCPPDVLPEPGTSVGIRIVGAALALDETTPDHASRTHG